MIKITRKMSLLEIVLICYYHDLSIKDIVNGLSKHRKLYVSVNL